MFLCMSLAQNYDFGQFLDQIWCCNEAFHIKSSSCPHDQRGTMAISTLLHIRALVIVFILINAFRANIGWIMMTLSWNYFFTSHYSENLEYPKSHPVFALMVTWSSSQVSHLLPPSKHKCYSYGFYHVFRAVFESVRMILT